MHWSSSDQCRGKETWKESHVGLKMHLYEAHSLRVTVTVHQYPLWDLLLMLLYTTEITTTACKTKSTWVAIWIRALCALLQAEIWVCSLSHYKDTLPFRISKMEKHSPNLQGEQCLKPSQWTATYWTVCDFYILHWKLNNS